MKSSLVYPSLSGPSFAIMRQRQAVSSWTARNLGAPHRLSWQRRNWETGSRVEGRTKPHAGAAFLHQREQIRPPVHAGNIQQALRRRRSSATGFMTAIACRKTATVDASYFCFRSFIVAAPNFVAASLELFCKRMMNFPLKSDPQANVSGAERGRHGSSRKAPATWANPKRCSRTERSLALNFANA